MENGSSSSRIWIVAGEASGDMYGARLAKEIARLHSSPDSLKIQGMGGQAMANAGVELLVDSSELGVVGLVEVLGSIFKFIRILLFMKREAARLRPDAVVLIDYPGFNIRLAKILWRLQIPVVWYISPQVWVWRKSNIPKLARYCSKMMLIFPFEIETYAGTGLDAEFVGHPLVDIVRDRTDGRIARDPDRVILLPGSRKSETSRLLEPMLRTAALLKSSRPSFKFTIAAPRQKVYDEISKGVEDFKLKNPDVQLPDFEISCGETARWLQEGSFGIAASGTVTVECAIAGLPLVVVYKLNPITFLLARIAIGKLFRGFFTMVNIIAYKRVFEEFLQHQVIPEDIAAAALRIAPGGERREEVLSDMDSVASQLCCGSEGASSRAASSVESLLVRTRRELSP